MVEEMGLRAEGADGRKAFAVVIHEPRTFGEAAGGEAVGDSGMESCVQIQAVPGKVMTGLVAEVVELASMRTVRNGLDMEGSQQATAASCNPPSTRTVEGQAALGLASREPGGIVAAAKPCKDLPAWALV